MSRSTSFRPTSMASLVCGLALLAAPAYADPAFDFGKKEEIKEVVWKASAQAGLIITSGNSSTVSVSGGLAVSRNDGWNKISLDANGTYANSQVRSPTDTNGNGLIDGDTEAKNRTSQTTAQQWLAKLRYDRFFTDRNSGYIVGIIGQDVIAGKSLVGGGQIGYSRLILKSERNELAGEVGYDFSYARFAKDDSSVMMHSIRLFLGYVLTLTKDTAINASAEALLTGNPIDVGGVHYGPFEEFRITGKAGLTTKIYKNISFRFGFTARYDNAPAPLALTLPAMTALAPGYTPLAEKLDTTTEATIVVTFL